MIRSAAPDRKLLQRPFIPFRNHASRRTARFRGGSGPALCSPPARSSVSGEPQNRRHQSRYCLRFSPGGGLRRRMFLAWMPGARHLSEIQPGLLAPEAGGEQGEGCPPDRQIAGRWLESDPGLGARLPATARKLLRGIESACKRRRPCK